jgi:hypothetical protein
MKNDYHKVNNRQYLNSPRRGAVFGIKPDKFLNKIMSLKKKY